MQTLSIEKAVKVYGRHLALKEVSFEAKAGEVVAICGENGAGKSTLIALLAGARQPTLGRILIDGQPVTIQNPQHAFDLGIRTVYQELSLLLPLSVTENLLLGEGGFKKLLSAFNTQRCLNPSISLGLAEVGIGVLELSPKHATLEELFFRLTEDGASPAPDAAEPAEAPVAA